MQEYAKSNRLSLNTFLFFIAVLFLAFLPISSFLFFIKNDAFNGYFPPKFFMSESIRSGHLPLWNPYINYGFPQYGDMSGGYWSPVTWLIASTIGYSAFTFTTELLLYILIGGIGMYTLTGYFQLSKTTRLIAGISFMCCGYNVGHLQHFNWISGAAFLPWCIWCYLYVLKKPHLSNIVLAILLFYMLIASAHPGIIISTFYFFAGVAVFNFFENRAGEPLRERVKKSLSIHFFIIAGLLLLSAGMIAGYTDIIPYFLRGEKLELTSSLLNSTTVASWTSVLFPFATVKNEAFFKTDISMRNCYFGIGLLLFFLLSCIRKKTAWQKFFLITGLLFALLSSGGIFKIFAYKFIPFLGYVRLNGEFRIFAICSFMLSGAIELDKFLSAKEIVRGKIKWLILTLQAISIAAIFYGCFRIHVSQDSLFYRLPLISAVSGISAKLKVLIDHISFYDTLWIQGMIQVVFLQAVQVALKQHRHLFLKVILSANLIISTLLNVPFTGAGKASVSQLQKVLDKSPKGITIPLLLPVNKIDTLSNDEKFLLGNWSMYNKQIGTKQEVAYPIILKNMRAYFDLLQNDSSSGYPDKPFVFIKNRDEDNRLEIREFKGNKIAVSIYTDSPTVVVMKQNWYPHWFYGNKPVLKEGVSFMAVPVEKGGHDVVIEFRPQYIIYSMLFSLILFIAMIFLLIYLKFKQPSLSSPRQLPHP